jgi:nucleoside-diphosphate-sugar epimerase
MRILCLGGSYTGKALAQLLKDKCEVVFLARDPIALRRVGFQATSSTAILNSAEQISIDMVVDSVPPVYNADGRLTHPYAEATNLVLKQGKMVPIVHLSSTSVYPSMFSEEREEELPVLDEDSPTRPESERGVRRELLEEYVSGLWPGIRIVRSGGIYGPGRWLGGRFRAGDFGRIGSGNKMVSRIHVYDLARLILALSNLSGDQGPYVMNAVDEKPSSNKETFTYLEHLLGIKIPGGWREARPQGRKIVSNYVKTLLGDGFMYPSYKEGFAECLAKE